MCVAGRGALPGRVSVRGRAVLACILKGVLARAKARFGRARGPVLFAFSGGSGTWPRMGCGLYATEPVFRATVDACDGVARALGVAVSEAFSGDGLGEPADAAEGQRRMLVHLGVLQLALCDLWADAGVRPDAVLSLSLGEVTSAYCAEALSRDEAVGALCSVARMVATHELAGVLFTLCCDAGAAHDLSHAAPRQLDYLGSINHAKAMVYCTDADAGENAAYVEASGLLEVRNSTRWPYHTMRSPYELGVMRDELAHLDPRPPRMPVYSAVAGRDIAPDAAFDALHWHWMIGHAFHYGEATAAALGGGPGVIVNIGPAPVTDAWIRPTADRLGLTLRTIDSMRRGSDVSAWREARGALRPQRSGGSMPRPPSPATDLDLASSGIARDPFPALASLRASAPVHKLERQDVWLVVGYDAVREALSRPEVLSSRPPTGCLASMVQLDPPEHTAARRELAPMLRASGLAELGALATRTARELLPAGRAAAEFDVVGQFAAPLGEQIGAELLGLDEDELSSIRLAAGHPERAAAELFVDRDDAVLKRLLPVGSLRHLLWVASTTTTKRVITAAVLLVLRDSELRDHLRGEPGVLGALVDEAMRLHPPERMLPRVTTAEVTLGGVTIPTGSAVRLSLVAANRDPAHFEDPERVRLDRRRGEHLSFGAGVHRCPGAKLARIEAEAALGALFERMPDFRAVQPACALRWIPSDGTHGLEQLLIAP
jgi:cytochrome P450